MEYFLIYWLLFNVLLMFSGKLGLEVGFWELRRALGSMVDHEKLRSAGGHAWLRVTAVLFVCNLLLGLIGFTSPSLVNDWLAFSLLYGDPRLLVSAIAYVFGAMSVVFAVARKTALGEFGQWRWSKPRPPATN